MTHAFQLQENIFEVFELNAFKFRKNDNFFPIIDQIKVSRYCCESGIIRWSLKISLTFPVRKWEKMRLWKLYSKKNLKEMGIKERKILANKNKTIENIKYRIFSKWDFKKLKRKI